MGGKGRWKKFELPKVRDSEKGEKKEENKVEE